MLQLNVVETQALHGPFDCLQVSSRIQPDGTDQRLNSSSHSSIGDDSSAFLEIWIWIDELLETCGTATRREMAVCAYVHCSLVTLTWLRRIRYFYILSRVGLSF